MSTYSELLSNVLALCEAEGDTDTTNVAKIGLERAASHIAVRLNLRKASKKATYTWGASDTSVSIAGASGFNISDFQTPLRLYVNGVPYVFREYLTFLDLKNLPSGYRYDNSSPLSSDGRPDFCWTINSDEAIEINQVKEGDVLTLWYEAALAPFGNGSGSPPIPAKFHFIVQDGACLITREFQRDPDAPISYTTLLSSLNPMIDELFLHDNSTRKRTVMRMHRSYR